MIILKLLLLFIILYAINYFMKKKTSKKIRYIETDNHKRIQKYQDFSDILFNIEGFYYYNPQAYIDLLKYTDLFLEIYELIKIDNHYSTTLYDNLHDLKYEIVNTLISFEITLPKEYNLDDIITDYSSIMDKYMYSVYEIHENYIKKNGMDYTIKLIDNSSHIHPEGYNTSKNILDPKNKNYFSRY